MAAAEWIDLLDPDDATLRRAWTEQLHPLALEDLAEPTVHDDEPRPKLESHGDYIFGVLLVPVEVPDENRVYYQEIDMVVTQTAVLTVRKTPKDGEAIDLTAVHECVHAGLPAGMIAYHVFDQVAESFLDLVDALHDEIDELEDHVEDWEGARVREELSSLRHDILHVRRTLSPTRDAVRRVFDDRVDAIVGEVELFDRDTELHFADAYEKLMRASEGLDLSRDLAAGVRDYYQSKVANEQNEVMKRLTIVASLLLPASIIVGFYGMNVHGGPEYHWSFGYEYVIALIAIVTVVQLVWFRRKRWL